MASWRIFGLELMEQRSDGNHPFGWGSYAMVPWAGRIKHGRFFFGGNSFELPRNFFGQHAIHGTTLDTEWIHLTGGVEWAMIGTRLEDPWPFGGTATHLMHLTPNSFTQTITIAAGSQDMPVSLGWHPWFRRQLERGTALELDVEMSDAKLFLRGDEDIPTGELVAVPPRPWDDCFVGVGRVSMNWPGALKIDVIHDCAKMVIFDPPHAICVEPQSHVSNSFNLDPSGSRLAAGDVIEHTVQWRWTMASSQG